MPVRWGWSGLEEFKAQLRSTPEHLRGEATHVVEGRANGAAVLIRAGYGAHRVTGNLQESVEVRHEHSAHGARSVVAATAPHAHLFEFGTQARKRASGAETGAMWSRTPPVPVFIPAMDRERRGMYGDLKAMLQRAGFEVSGDAG